MGKVAPDFSLTDQAGNSWSLADKRGKVVLLLFYPANETLVCTKQLCSLRDNWAKYLDTKAEIVGVSSGDTESNRIFAQKHHLPLAILSDSDRTVTSQYTRHKIFPLNLMRALTVVDAHGIIRTHQSMLRAFRPNDHDIILNLYAARSAASEAKHKEIRTRVRKVMFGM